MFADTVDMQQLRMAGARRAGTASHRTQGGRGGRVLGGGEGLVWLGSGNS